MSNDFERTTRIVNGYWYTFEYHNQKETVPGYDRFPMIYCIGPSTKNLNCFEALNLHHLPLEVRIEFMCRFDKLSHFRDEDIRKVFTTEEVLSYFGAGLGLQNVFLVIETNSIL